MDATGGYPNMQRRFRFTQAFLFLLLLQIMATEAHAQTQPQKKSAQSSSSAAPGTEAQDSTSGRPRQPEAGGAAITLETSEQLFDVMVGLNACGYDTDLDNSPPVRAEIRAEVDAATASTPEVKKTREALCVYIHDHALNDKARELAQYVSLALYLSPPPDLNPTVEETEMPPDALQVVNILPTLRAFSNAIVLHALWQKHHAEYEAITNAIHDPVTKMILDTNIYLRLPVSSYDGRRFLVLMEPMLAAREPNGRIYATDYIIVSSPNAGGGIRMDQIRHIYLQYAVEPLVYARAAAMDRLLPLLKPVQRAPLEFVYKSDVTLLLTECLIKAIEARTMDVGFPRPIKPVGTKDRQEFARYESEMTTYDRNAEEVRRRTVDLDMRQGWVLTDYFYDQLVRQEKDSIGLKENIGDMVYGMDVLRQARRESEIVFLPPSAIGSSNYIKRVPRQPTGMMLAEKKMLEGDIDGARAIAEKALDDPKGDRPEANYVLARVQLMEGEPESAVDTFHEVLKSSQNPHTLAWSHIYLGRLYDTLPNRQKALAEYKSALAITGVTPDARFAAEEGMKQPYTLPKSTHTAAPADDEPLDPSGKAEKDAYKPE